MGFNYAYSKRHPKRRILFVLVAVIALAGLVAYMVPASGQVDKRTRDDLAGKLDRREKYNARCCRSRSRDGAGGDVDSGGTRVRMAHSSGRRGRLHYRRPSRDEDTGTSTVLLNPGDGFLIPPQTPHNARDIRPETGRMLSTYIVETGQPIATFVKQPVER